MASDDVEHRRKHHVHASACRNPDKCSQLLSGLSGPLKEEQTTTELSDLAHCYTKRLKAQQSSSSLSQPAQKTIVLRLNKLRIVDIQRLRPSPGFVHNGPSNHGIPSPAQSSGLPVPESSTEGGCFSKDQCSRVIPIAELSCARTTQYSEHIRRKQQIRASDTLHENSSTCQELKSSVHSCPASGRDNRDSPSKPSAPSSCQKECSFPCKQASPASVVSTVLSRKRKWRMPMCPWPKRVKTSDKRNTASPHMSGDKSVDDIPYIASSSLNVYKEMSAPSPSKYRKTSNKGEADHLQQAAVTTSTKSGIEKTCPFSERKENKGSILCSALSMGSLFPVVSSPASAFKKEKKAVISPRTVKPVTVLKTCFQAQEHSQSKQVGFNLSRSQAPDVDVAHFSVATPPGGISTNPRPDNKVPPCVKKIGRPPLPLLVKIDRSLLKAPWVPKCSVTVHCSGTFRHVETQTDPLFVADKESVVKLVQAEMKNSLSALRSKLALTERKVERLVCEKEKLEEAIHEKTVLLLTQGQSGKVSSTATKKLKWGTCARTQPHEEYNRHKPDKPEPERSTEGEYRNTELQDFVDSVHRLYLCGTKKLSSEGNSQSMVMAYVEHLLACIKKWSNITPVNVEDNSSEMSISEVISQLLKVVDDFLKLVRKSPSQSDDINHNGMLDNLRKALQLQDEVVRSLQSAPQPQTLNSTPVNVTSSNTWPTLQSVRHPQIHVQPLRTMSQPQALTLPHAVPLGPRMSVSTALSTSVPQHPMFSVSATHPIPDQPARRLHMAYNSQLLMTALNASSQLRKLITKLN